SGKPVAFATVALLSNTSQRAITGANTNEKGAFSLQADSTDVYLVISSIGFEKKEIRNLSVQQGRVALGKILLTENQQTLDVVNIVAEKSSVEFRLDKRVFNVGTDLSSTGMGALDLL